MLLVFIADVVIVVVVVVDFSSSILCNWDFRLVICKKKTQFSFRVTLDVFVFAFCAPLWDRRHCTAPVSGGGKPGNIKIFTSCRFARNSTNLNTVGTSAPLGRLSESSNNEKQQRFINGKHTKKSHTKKNEVVVLRLANGTDYIPCRPILPSCVASKVYDLVSRVLHPVLRQQTGLFQPNQKIVFVVCLKKKNVKTKKKPLKQ